MHIFVKHLPFFALQALGQMTSEWDDLPTDDVDIPPNPADFENLYAKAKSTTGKVHL